MLKIASLIVALLGCVLTFGQVSSSTSEVKLVPHYSDSTQVMVKDATQPSYPGGNRALYMFLEAELNYPELAARDSIEGVLYVEFIVETDGRLSDVELLRGLGGGCAQEAIRIVGLMPPWNPGLHNGEPTAMKYRLPIRFRRPSADQKIEE